MPATTLKHLLLTSTLMFAATTASALTTSPTTFSDPDVQAMLAHSKPAQSAKRAEPAARKTLHVGLSDPESTLVLPWFLADLVDAVNQRTSLQDFAKKLQDGI